ncbi:DsrE family protein [Streptomyces sp. NPDC001933]|uniref:DsrE family protein n=1 Tax=Streptomyces sp. NPDC001933 TaxID=3364626 RepID=UPI00367EFFF6
MPTSRAATVRVVVAAPQPDRVARATTNLLAAADHPLDVEIVLYGAGVDLILDRIPPAEAAALHEAGARVLVCANTLKGRGLTAEVLPPWVGVVDAAVWHLALRQHQGWSLVPVW